jgi:hypothetical protein
MDDSEFKRIFLSFPFNAVEMIGIYRGSRKPEEYSVTLIAQAYSEMKYKSKAIPITGHGGP